MSQYLLCTLIPAVMVILWALIVKMRAKEWKNVFFLVLASSTLLANGYAVYHMLLDVNVPMWLLLMQLILSPTVVPQAYLYFCRQMGTDGSRGVHIALWSLLGFLLVPSLCIDIHPFTEPSMCEPLQFLHFNIFDHGTLIYTISMPSLIITLQAIITSIRIPVVTKALRVYELRFSRGGRSFVIWWVLAIVFCVVVSLLELETLRIASYSWVYFISYSALISMIFLHMALGMDIHPLQTLDDQEEVVNMDDFIEANRELAQRARRLFMEEKLYLRQGLVTDDVVSMLGTNRTYFTRMMRSEFKMSFNEFITSERIAYSQQLLAGTDKTMEEIAEESGFGNGSAYCRVFKRLTNTTPDAWRHEHKRSDTE